jgi:fructokinase
MYAAIGLGQTGIDFLPAKSGGTLMDAGEFQCFPGGTPANSLVAMAKLGLEVALIARISTDMWGKRITHDLFQAGVSVDFISHDPLSPSSIAFSTDGLNGDPQFMVYGYPGAFSHLAQEDVPEEPIRKSRLFIFGSLTLDQEPAFTATWHGIKLAQKHGVPIVFDPNYRPPQWPDPHTAKRIFLEAASTSKLIKLNRLELELLTGKTDLVSANSLLNQTTELVIITLGAEGAAFINRTGLTKVTAIKPEVTDPNTLGCGDAFLGTVLCGLLGELTDEGFPIHSWQNSDDIAKIILLGNLAGSVTAERPGIWNAFFNRADLLQEFKRRCEHHD